MMPLRIYLAGPDVFHADAARLGATKKALCREYGFAGLFPLDGPEESARAIYQSCVAMMRDADFGIFNLTPFRGPSADVGTAFELGAMVAAGKQVFAYTNTTDDLIDRLHADPGLTFDETTRVWRDPLGLMAEEFGNADNLMLDEALAAQGRHIHRRAVPQAHRFTDSEGFVACLREASAILVGDA